MAAPVMPADPVPPAVSDLPVLRFLVCGSVDDGKSTLIGRLLYDAGVLFDDQLERLRPLPDGEGTALPDFAALVDGLRGEREGGITIDVAHRYFRGAGRRFIVLDAPGHEQYTANMATAASAASLAVVVVDASRGLQAQTLRHSRIAALMGIRQIVLAVNKMDLVDGRQDVFDGLVRDYRAAVAGLAFASIRAVPVAARGGENIVAPGRLTPWYPGPSIMACLEQAEIGAPPPSAPFRMAVQWLGMASATGRFCCGRIIAGQLRVGDPVIVLPAGVTARIGAIGSGFDPVMTAAAGDSISVTLDRPVDVARGDVLAAAAAPPPVALAVTARLVWFGRQPLAAGVPLLVRVASHEVSATVAAVLDRLDVATGQAESAAALGLNDIGTVRFVLSAPLIAEPAAAGNALGRLILIDRYDSATLGGGLVLDVADEGAALSGRADTPDDHLSGRARPPGLCLWLTGLSGAGKTTIAALVERQLRACGRPVILLDGDRIRQGLSRDLGFSPSDRVENMRRVGEVAALMADAGLVVLVALISPFAAERRMVRDVVGPGRFVEVFVDTSLAECERRDVKGLYARARRGEVRAFTGLDSPYEPPSAPDLVLATAGRTPEDCAGELLRRIHAHPVAGA